MGRARMSRLGPLLAVLLCVYPASPLWAIDSLSLELGDLQGAGWSLGAGRLQLAWTASGTMQGELQAARVSLPAGFGELRALRLQCTDLQQQGPRLQCREGRLTADSSWLGALAGAARWQLDRTSGALALQLTELSTPHGGLGLALQLQQGRWQATLALEAFAVAALPGLAAPWYALDPAWEQQGRLQGRIELQGQGGEATALTLDLQLQGFGFANAAGTQAGEALQGRVQLQGQPAGGGWQAQLQLSVHQGQLYSDPIYLEFSPAAPLQLETLLALEAGELRLTDVQWRHRGVLQFAADARLQLGEPLQLTALQLAVEQARFPAAFTTYVQPWIVDSGFADLRTRGALQGRLHYDATRGLTQLALQLQEVGLDDPRGRLQLEGLAGQLDWAADEKPRRQQIRWRRGQLYRVALGGTELALDTVGRRLWLAEPARLEVLDGRLLVDHFELHHDEVLEWSLDAALTPVSMPALTTALGWPEMAGTLSGMIPGVHYRDGDLQLGGTLLVGAFDGDITVRNLRMEQPLGPVPRLWADVNIRQLDLETLTRTFAFGKIEGRLNGAVQDLYLEAWRPVAFDAWLATPEDDPSRHRISQRAVDNLTNIGGGGVGGALSRGFLRFLEDFPYQALGLRCRLENGVCMMGGVAPAENGYYLVKGRTLPPRIDIIGYEERVDWDALLERLQAVTAEQGPVVR